jgi:hypothetical protein
MFIHRVQALVVSFLVLSLSATTLFAQPVPTKNPDSVHLFPAGAQRGTTVNVHIGLEQSPPNTKFFIRGVGVTGDHILSTEVFDLGQPSPRRDPTETPINYPRQWSSQVSVALDAPVGVASWDTFCASGGSSGSLPFVIGDLPEFIEKESNSSLNTAHSITLPVTVNGQIHGERDLDYYAMDLQTDEVIYGEVLARRLGSKLEPTIAIFDALGKQHSYQEDSLGDDPLFAFKAPEAGTYYMQVGNVSFHGSTSHVYRINLTRKPFAPYVYPIGAPAGVPTDFRFLIMDGAGGTVTIQQKLTLEGAPGSYMTWEDEIFANRPRLRILHSNSSVITPHTDREQKEFPITVGQTVNSILSPFSQNRFRLTVTDKSPIDIRVHAPSHSSAASLIIVSITDASGDTVTRTKLKPTSAAIKVYHHFANPKPGEYLVDVQSLGGLKSDHRLAAYQLEVSAAIADFSLESQRDCITIVQGKSLEIPITVNRQGGFQGEIKLRLSGLPVGISVENDVIAAGKLDTKLKLTLPENEPSTRHQLEIFGEAVIHDLPVSRTLLAQHRGKDSFQRSVDSAYREFIAVAVAHKPIFRLYCEEAYQYAHRGTIYPYLMTLERLDGFKEPVIIQTCDRQNRDLDGIQFLTTTLAPETADFMMPIYLPETMHINIQSQSQLYTQAYATFMDSHGQQQHVMVVSEKRNMIRTMPTVTKLYDRSGKLSGQSGDQMTLKLNMQRTSNMLNTMTLKVTAGNSELASLLPKEMVFPQGQRDLEIPFSIPKSLSPGKYTITLEAQGALDSKPDHTVVTAVNVTLTVRE